MMKTSKEDVRGPHSAIGVSRWQVRRASAGGVRRIAVLQTVSNGSKRHIVSPLRAHYILSGWAVRDMGFNIDTYRLVV